MTTSLQPILDLEVPDLAATAWIAVVLRAHARSREIADQRLNFHEITDQYHDDWQLLHRYEYNYFYSAWVGLAFRFRACMNHSQIFTEIFQRTGGASQNIDLYQEDDALFDFFVKGFSAIECFFYSLYALGALIHTPAQSPSVPPPPQFPLLDPKDAKKLKSISPILTLNAFAREFPKQPITQHLEGLLKDARYKEWKDIRNLLAHRVASAGRSLQYSGPFLFQNAERPIAVTQWSSDLSLDSVTTSSRYDWLKQTINSSLEVTAAFTAQHLPFTED
jgi:hypothetical protein